ncbi:MAG: dimethylargininase [Candidatus Krumholzibacteriota bacterium]|nr:dimethylargininase [Candidatus Krumholzibacteriota bacterium]
MIALTRPVSDSIARCELTHLAREPIDLGRARRQHAAYERLLEALGCRLVRLPAEPEMPDAVFVEDAAVVVDEVAVISRPGAEARRRETASVAAALGRLRHVERIEAPATLDGGDVLRAGRRIWVGRSGRTNEAGIERLAALLAPHGYTVTGVPVTGCLHLKSAVTALGGRRLLVNRAWAPAEAFDGFELVDVDPGEPFAANALSVGGPVVYSSAFPKTRRRLERAGIDVQTVELDELAKAEGAVTCCSILVDTDDAGRPVPRGGHSRQTSRSG